MITKNTVFVLGAGASSDFGFPLGLKLREEIIQRFNKPNKLEVEYIAQALCGSFPHEFKDYIPPITQFANKLYHDADYSIDVFLERFQKTYLKIGKLAIAQILAKSENHDKLYGSDNWYRILYQRMKKDASIDTFSQNKISFVTFNYDRSLEHFLYTSLMNFDENIRKEHVLAILNKIPIVHLYGQLDYLDWQDSEGRVYGNSITVAQLRRYRENICIIFENMTKEINDNFQKAIELLKQAERIFILGFGFHPINMDRLKLNEIKEKNIIATSYGLGLEEIEFIRRCLASSGYPSITIYSSVNNAERMTSMKGAKLYNMPVYDFISKFAVLD